MTTLVIVGDQALSDRELATRERLRAWGRKRYRERMADPEYRRRRHEAQQRSRVRDGGEYHREWMRQYRARQRGDAIRAVASLHDLRCTGPTRSTGCRCRKVTLYERVAA